MKISSRNTKNTINDVIKSVKVCAKWCPRLAIGRAGGAAVDEKAEQEAGGEYH
jgi:hypothetical protein